MTVAAIFESQLLKMATERKMSVPELKLQVKLLSDPGVRLACRSLHYRFDGDICTTAQAPLATGRRPSGKQRLTDQSIVSLLI